MTKTVFNRRGFLKGTAAITGAALAMPNIARASSYPDRNINVVIPTPRLG